MTGPEWDDLWWAEWERAKRVERVEGQVAALRAEWQMAAQHGDRPPDAPAPVAARPYERAGRGLRADLVITDDPLLTGRLRRGWLRRALDRVFG